MDLGDRMEEKDMLKFLCLIDTDDRNFYFNSALKRLEQEYPGEISGQVFSPGMVNMSKTERERLMEAAKECDFAFVYFHTSCSNMQNFYEFWELLTNHAPSYYLSSLAEEMEELAATAGLTVQEYQSYSEYFWRISEENCYNMLLHAAYHRFGKGKEPAPYVETPLAGIYIKGSILDEEQEKAYLKEAEETDKTVVGLLLVRGYIHSGNTKAIDALIEELDRQGAYPLPIFSSLSADSENPQTGIRYSLEKYFCPNGKKVVDCIMSTTLFSLTNAGYPEGGKEEFRTSLFEKWDVPVIKTSVTRMSAEQYEEKTQGIDSMSITGNVYFPEMDGQLTTVPYAVTESAECDGFSRKIWVPLSERIEHVCKLALRFAALSKKRNQEKKIAILFHNLPGNHNIGRGSGLDTFASEQKLLVNMQERGYTLDTVYEDGQEIADSLIKGLTNDLRWISMDEAARRAVDQVSQQTMSNWYEKIPAKNKDKLQEVWGDFPGEQMIENGKMLVPGILNGNIFIGLQPSRAYGEQADRIYHDPIVPPPYNYMGYYRWIEESFGADAVIHVGTHGTVEWLPGKEVGLSNACYPDICMGTLPNFYIYHMGVTGEGIQAKRRSSAVILEHLPPSMDESGVYEKLTDVEGALKEYYSTKQARTGQIKVLQQRIYELAEETELIKDLRFTKEAYDADPDAHIDKLHVWLEELKNSAVKDGLHIFGEAPDQGALYENMLRMLVRVKNGDIPSLNDAVLEAKGYEAEQIKDAPTKMVEGRLASVIYEEAVEIGKMLVHQLSENNYQTDQVEEFLKKEAFQGDVQSLKKVLIFLCEMVNPKLRDTTDEMKNILRGLEGAFVEPGLGGNPTRGNVALLPTGRNFYAGDPSEIPSRGAWDIGQKLAARSLEHYQEERGEYPESIAMVIWSGNVMKTCGEDFGEIFALLGVRPIYLGATSKVIGLEAIPIKELGRPRIDVTLRISGLFRDMYPNLIELMDTAIACAASQDESEEQNYVKKHINEDMEKLLKEGMDAKEAMDQAYVRVFGCAAGGYGAGVSNVIENRNWKDFHDLAAVYETWSGNAYGRGFHGQKAQKMFKRRLASVGMTIKNESTVETDMLSSDDYFSYHGGLIACVKSNSGNMPIAITGHSDDPERPCVRDTAKETARIMRSRVLNPKWLEGLKRHGFKGAQEISKSIDSFFGWDASAEVAEDWMYEQIASDFLFDQDTKEWIEKVNPGVLHDVAGKLLEANKRGMWSAKEETRSKLQNLYLDTEGLLEDI